MQSAQLRKIRKALKLSQRELAALAQVNRFHLIECERKGTALSDQDSKRVRAVLNKQTQKLRANLKIIETELAGEK